MSATSSTRRDPITTSAVVGAVSLLPEHFAVAAESNAVRPFRVNVSLELATYVAKKGRRPHADQVSAP
jgi:hypothetical protein